VEDHQRTEGEGSPAVRDAEEILRRADDDEREAIEARARYRAEGLPELPADELVVDRLRPEERVVDVRHAVVVNHHPTEGAGSFPGRLYLTTSRLVLLGLQTIELELHAIEEVGVAGERLLITLRDATGMSIEASRPRLLRVQIAAALAAARV
jgi:hypothetical protein